MMERIIDFISSNGLVLPATNIIISMVVVLPFPILSASPEILSFSFPDPGEGSWTRKSLHLEGDANISGEGITLTADGPVGSTGRATYFNPLHLWDRPTGRVADFNSNFSFVIQAEPGTIEHADGLTFFLAPNGTTMPVNSIGGGFTLVNKTTLSDDDQSYVPFIAVEFDTYYDHNSWDPRYEHVGIDLNSIKSANTTPWLWNRIDTGGKVDVVVVYNSSQKILSVKLTDAENASAFSTVDHIVNMMDYLPEWVIFGFSASTGQLFETHTIKSWNFVSSLEVPSTENEQPPSGTSNETQPITPVLLPPPPRKKKNNYWQWIITGAGSFLLLCFVVGFLWAWRQSKRNKGNQGEDEDTTEPIDQEFAKLTGPKRFSFKEVVTATNDFSNDRLLGEGGFGRVYKGYLREGNCEVAIKKITPDSRQGIKEYASEVKTISQLRHRNLVQLVGWCHQNKELLLIYEFMSNGSLDTHLFKGKSLLTWEMRHKIAQGLALAVLYLHEEWEQCVLHRDIKSSNIMLDSDFNAKLGDFGLARLVNHAKGFQTTDLAGTLGYMAPECVYTGKVSKESDIYSFGVVIIEMACGRKVNDPIDGGIRLVDWVWEFYGIGKLLDAVDPKLQGEYDPSQIQCLMVLGLWCAHPDCNSRPTIREALSVLNFETFPPILPSKPPVPTYSKPQEYEPFPPSHSSLEMMSRSSSDAA